MKYFGKILLLAAVAGSMYAAEKQLDTRGRARKLWDGTCHYSGANWACRNARDGFFLGCRTTRDNALWAWDNKGKLVVATGVGGLTYACRDKVAEGLGKVAEHPKVAGTLAAPVAAIAMVKALSKAKDTEKRMTILEDRIAALEEQAPAGSKGDVPGADRG